MWEQLDQPPLYSEVDDALQRDKPGQARKFQEDNVPGKELACYRKPSRAIFVLGEWTSSLSRAGVVMSMHA
jgi:hypothetical protein